MSTHRRLTCALALSAMVLAGCAQIPRSSEVVGGGRVDVPADSRGLEPVALGPVSDASAAQIADGLIAAMVSSADEYRVARSYLMHDLAADWQPRNEAVVFDGAPKVVLSGATGGRVTGSITVTQTASVTQDGRYRRLSPSARVVPVELTVDADRQWRVSRLADLTLISAGDFQFSYRSHVVYFLRQDSGALIPVQRYLPNGSGLATRLAAAVLSGPPPGTRDGYGNAVPEGTRLAPPAAVTTKGPTAVVELTDTENRATQAMRVALRAQLRLTLSGVLPVDDVQLTVGGGALDIAGGFPAPQPLAQSEGLPVLLAGSKVFSFDGEQVTAVPKLPDLSGADPSSVAVAEGERRLAVVAGGGTRMYLVTPGRSLGRPVLQGAADLTQPSFDASGWVWSASSRSAGHVYAVSPDRDPRRVAAPWLAGRSVDALRISPGGGLAAVVSRSSGVGRLDVVAVRREKGVPMELVRVKESTRSLPAEDVRGVSWRSPVELSVATTGGVGFLALDGPIRAAGRAPAAGGIASGAQTGVGDLLLGTNRRLYQYESGAWYRVGDLGRVRSVAFPG